MDADVRAAFDAVLAALNVPTEKRSKLLLQLQETLEATTDTPAKLLMACATCHGVSTPLLKPSFKRPGGYDANCSNCSSEICSLSPTTIVRAAYEHQESAIKLKHRVFTDAYLKAAHPK